jgi:integrase
MPRRGHRVRLERGIFRDASGIAVTAKIGSGQTARQAERRFPLRTSIAQLRKVREQLRVQLRLRAPLPAAPGTLGADVPEYLKTVRESARANATILLGHWLTAGFRSTSRHAITALDVRQQLTAWSDQGCAASTVNHRRTALMSLYRVLDGADGRNPVRAVPRIPEDNEEARGFSYALVDAILAQLPDQGRPTGKGTGTRPTVSQTKARLRVMAYTGLPQSVLARIESHHLHLDGEAPSLDAMPRRKGKRTRPQTIPLIPQAVDAFTALLEANALGSFSTDSMVATFRRAVAKARAAWTRKELEAGTRRAWPLPDNLRPYDVRHAFGTETYRRTGDLRATADLMLHADIRTTMRYARAAVSERAQRAVLAWSDKETAGTKAGTTTKAR